MDNPAFEYSETNSDVSSVSDNNDSDGPNSGESIEINKFSSIDARTPSSSSPTLTCHNIKYTVRVTPPGKCFGLVKQSILQDISGIFLGGSLNAIMGASGSGKTTLLDILAKRKDPKGQKGKVKIDGASLKTSFKNKSGYVVQDDLVTGTLTIRENLMFSANLRLPETISKNEKEKRVEETLEELSLQHVADCRIGHKFLRGVSGGERKRTSIGMELIVQPKVIFLDEPTSGLDSHTANSLILLLHRISRTGKTIIFSIHQPRFSIFKLFDQLMLLSKGRNVYHGPASEALDFFSSIGYTIQPHDNPADFFLDIMNGEAPQDEQHQTSQLECHGLDNYNDSRIEDVEVLDEMEEVEVSNADLEIINIANKLHEYYLESAWWKRTKSTLEPLLLAPKKKSSKLKPKISPGSYPTSFSMQFQVLFGRSFLNYIRHPQRMFMQMVVMTMTALLIGLIYRDVGNSVISGIQNRTGALFFVVLNQIFSNIGAIELFISEREMFIHETSNGFYRVSPYFLSKVVCDLAILRTVPIFGYCFIVYFLMGLQTKAVKFVFFLLVVIVTRLSSACVTFFIGALIPIFAIANLLAIVEFGGMMIFGGYLAIIGSFDPYINWLHYGSIFKYGINALYINEMKDLTLCKEMQHGITNTTEAICSKQFAKQYLIDHKIAFDTDWDLWINLLAMIIIGIVHLIMAYIVLRCIRKYR